MPFYIWIKFKLILFWNIEKTSGPNQYKAQKMKNTSASAIQLILKVSYKSLSLFSDEKNGLTKGW